MKLSEFLIQYRREHQMSMDDLSRVSGLSKAYIGMLEKNRNSKNGKPIVPSIRTLNNLANAMGMSLDDFLHRIDGDEIVAINTPAPAKRESLISQLSSLYDLSELQHEALLKFLSLSRDDREAVSQAFLLISNLSHEKRTHLE